MTDLRNVAIIGMMGRLNSLVDEGVTNLPLAEVKQCIADGTILARLRVLYGDYPEFSPVHKAEAVLMQQEWKASMDMYDGREESKMGVSNNGLCMLLGYCIDMLMQRNLGEMLG
jgi:hypothetical protein